jgi:hypothetical protein
LRRQVHSIRISTFQYRYHKQNPGKIIGNNDLFLHFISIFWDKLGDVISAKHFTIFSSLQKGSLVLTSVNSSNSVTAVFNDREDCDSAFATKEQR